MFNRILIILGALVMMVVFSTAVGLGVLAYSLNTQLVQARAEVQSLKNTNDKLNNANNDLNTESTKTQGDLSAAQAQIVNLQGQLKKAQAENDSLQTELTTIQDKVSLLLTFEFGSETTIQSKVDHSGDGELQKLWAALQKTQSGPDAVKLLDYLIQSIADAAGLGQLPTFVQSGSLIGVAG